MVAVSTGGEEEGRERERVRVGEMLEQNVGLLLFYVSLCSHSEAAPEPSKSRLIDATKPTRAARKEMPRGSSYVRRFCITPVPAEGGGLVNHARREKRRGTPRGTGEPLRACYPRFTFLQQVFFFFTCIYSISLPR